MSGDQFGSLATKITVPSTVRAVIVLDAAVVAFPVTGEELLTIVPRSYPVRAFIRRTRPIPRMPAILAVNRILITVNPNVTGTGRLRTNAYHTWRRRRSNADPDANLSA